MTEAAAVPGLTPEPLPAVRNLAPNPSFESSVLVDASNLTRTANTYAPGIYAGTQSLKVDIVTAGAVTYVSESGDLPGEGETHISFAAALRFSTGSRYVRLRVGFKNDPADVSWVYPVVPSVNEQMSSNAVGTLPKRHVRTMEIPAGAKQWRALAYVYEGATGSTGPLAGTALTTDAWSVCVGSSEAEAEALALDYFDGDSASFVISGSPDRWAHSWDGAPHLSPSRRVAVGPAEWTRAWWETLPLAYRIAERDEVGGYPLMRYMDGPGSIAGKVQSIINDMWNGVYTDPARVPGGRPLRWLAMLLGIKPGGGDEDLRARMMELVAAGRSPAGTRAAIADATRPYLLGSRQVQVGPDKTIVNKIIVQVRADEVPPAGLAWVAAQVQRAGVAPAGHLVVLVAATSTWDAWSLDAGTSWDQKEVNVPTWITSDSAGVTLE